MPVSSQFQGQVFVVSMIGHYAYDDLAQAIISAYSHPNFTATTSVLVDARQSEANPSSDDVRHTSQKVVGRRPAGHSGKWAVLVGQGPLRFGIGRMGALTMGSLGVPMEVFT
jgi:hypothetical protein